MPQIVRGVVARSKGAPVSLEQITIPDPGPGELSSLSRPAGLPTPQMTLEMPFLDLFARGGALKSSWYGDCLPSRDFPMLVDLYQQGRLNFDAFVTEKIGIGDVETAFGKMQTGGVLRSVVEL